MVFEWLYVFPKVMKPYITEPQTKSMEVTNEEGLKDDDKIIKIVYFK